MNFAWDDMLLEGYLKEITLAWVYLSRLYFFLTVPGLILWKL